MSTSSTRAARALFQLVACRTRSTWRRSTSASGVSTDSVATGAAAFHLWRGRDRRGGVELARQVAHPGSPPRYPWLSTLLGMDPYAQPAWTRSASRTCLPGRCAPGCPYRRAVPDSDQHHRPGQRLFRHLLHEKDRPADRNDHRRGGHQDPAGPRGRPVGAGRDRLRGQQRQRRDLRRRGAAGAAGLRRHRPDRRGRAGGDRPGPVPGRGRGRDRHPGRRDRADRPDAGRLLGWPPRCWTWSAPRSARSPPRAAISRNPIDGRGPARATPFWACPVLACTATGTRWPGTSCSARPG